jgi:hypothetical protein
MAKEKAAVEEVVVETAEAVVEAPKASKAKVTSVTVRWRGQERTFSQADHGDDFEALAKEFATKFDGTIVA